jgi:hypothetical protein
MFDQSICCDFKNFKLKIRNDNLKLNSKKLYNRDIFRNGDIEQQDWFYHIILKTIIKKR